MGGDSTIELVLLVMVAAFLVFRLRSVLGRRIGFERAAAPAPPSRGSVAPVVDGVAEPATGSRDLPASDSPAGLGLAAISRADPGFSAQRFLAGAEGAFEIIVAAFARGDAGALRPLLDDATFAAFETAINARIAAGETQQSELRAIHGATIERAALTGSVADITVRFVSDQVSATLNRAGAVVHGTDAVTELTDIWTFERDLRQGGPAWKLTAARNG